MPISHEQRRIRRKAIADAIASGDLYSKVAVKFGVSIATVFSAMSENGVPAEGLRVSRQVNTLRIIQCLMGGLRPVDIAAEFGVSRQRIHTIRADAIKAGFKIPKARRKKT